MVVSEDQATLGYTIHLGFLLQTLRIIHYIKQWKSIKSLTSFWSTLWKLIVSYKHKPRSDLAKVSMKSFQKALYLITDYFNISNIQVIYFVGECQHLIHTTKRSWIILKYSINYLASFKILLNPYYSIPTNTQEIWTSIACILKNMKLTQLSFSISCINISYLYSPFEFLKSVRNKRSFSHKHFITTGI